MPQHRINVDSFTFNSFELYTSNVFTSLSEVDSLFDSITSSCFSPLHSSSPQSTTPRPRHTHRPSTVSSTHYSQESNSSMKDEVPPRSKNLRLLTVNYCGIRTNRAEFNTATEYVKPDLICRTESWLRGIKPGKDPYKNAIKSSEVFPWLYSPSETTEVLEQVVVYSWPLKNAS